MPISEIYIKTPNDPNYQSNIIDHNDVYETVLQKIRMILFTKRGEVIGDPNFGVNLEDYVFSLNASNLTIQREIEKQIQQYVPERMVMNISVNVNFIKGVTQDTAIVDILIEGTKALSVLVN